MTFAGNGFLAAETSVETVSMASGSVIVDNPCGSVLVQGGECDVVRVSGTKHVSSPSFGDQLRVVLEREGSNLMVRASGSHGTVDLVVDVPAEVGVVTRTDCGEVVVRGTSAPVHVHSDSGDVAVADVTGSVNVETRTGDVSVHTVRAPLTVVTAAGDVVAEVLHNADITSASGSISALVTWVRTGQRFEARTATGDVSVRGALGCSHGHVAVETDSGSVSVEVDAAALFVRTNSGDVNVVVPRALGVETAPAQAGGAPIDVESESGSVVLRYAET